ncbi:kinase-like domain-containing protein [Rhizophagus irregularis DAOM 181602=DAOM 197198]|nr:kinase-like domain-containing protein [Rhizophagus irregularis DAOM 181602=DAOM 197198]
MACKLDSAKNLFKYPRYAIPAPSEGKEVNEEDPYEVVYIDDLDKRKAAFGICFQCNEPGTGNNWCRPCNAKRFREEFKNWTSGNKIIDEFIQESQLNAVYYTQFLEWVPFDKFKDVTYVARGGFGKIYRAIWHEGHISFWKHKEQKWMRQSNIVALKSLDGSSDISIDFINEIRSHLQISVVHDIIECYGITQDPASKDYMMILEFCGDGNLRNYVANSKEYIPYDEKTYDLYQIVKGLKSIHDAGKVHKDFHSGNILCENVGTCIAMYISDLGLCRPVAEQLESGKIYGVLPYVAPEVLHGKQYSPAADIYSFGIVMNEFLSEEPEISEHVPKFLVDVIMKCWNAKAEDRPTAKELVHVFGKWIDEKDDENSEIYFQIKKGDEKYEECKSKNISKNTSSINALINKSDDNSFKFTQTHPQAIYTSRNLDFEISSDIELKLD